MGKNRAKKISTKIRNLRRRRTKGVSDLLILRVVESDSTRLIVLELDNNVSGQDKALVNIMERAGKFLGQGKAHLVLSLGE
jgi:hypothetical protein